MYFVMKLNFFYFIVNRMNYNIVIISRFINDIWIPLYSIDLSVCKVICFFIYLSVTGI